MTTLREAFSANGIKIEYKGNKGVMLPLTDSLVESLGEAELNKVRSDLAAGILLVKDSERGHVLDPFAKNDLTILVARSDGTDQRISAREPADAANQIIRAARFDTAEREKIAADHEKAMGEYDRARARGDDVETPVAATPTYADNALKNLGSFIEATQSGLNATIRDGFISAMEAHAALSAQASILRNLSVELSDQDLARAQEYRTLRQEIGRIAPNDPLAVAAPPAPYAAEDAGELARESVAALNVGRRGMGALDPTAMMPDRKLAEEVFAVLTTTPVNQVSATPLDPDEARRVADSLHRFADKQWNESAQKRVNEVISDRMPGYAGSFKTMTFTNGDADIFIVGDRGGLVMYAWDSASRVNDIDVKNTVLNKLSKDDVPTDDQLAAARARLHDLQHDNGADFEWDADHDPNDFGRGPRPEGA